MNDVALEFPEYAIKFSKNAIELRKEFPDSLRANLNDIVDELAEDPTRYSHNTIPLGENMFIYKNPSPPLEITYKINSEKEIIYIQHLAVPMMKVCKSLFISYSHKDEKWLLELKKWLVTLEQRDIIQIWDDKEIKSGDNWHEEIKKKLASAKAAVLLISQNFLASDFIANHELPELLNAAEKEGLTIFWIPVSESTVDDTEISKYQAVIKKPLENFKDETELKKQFQSIYNRIKEVVET